jgi:hypothetical protein
LVIGFINNLQVVTTINYYLLLLYTIYNHSTLISSVYLHLSSWIYNTGTIKVSLNHTLPISLHNSTHKVFKSHVKSSQAYVLYSSVLLVPIRSPAYFLLLYSCRLLLYSSSLPLSSSLRASAATTHS